MEIPFKYIDNFNCMFNGRKIEDNKILKNIFPNHIFGFKVPIINNSRLFDDTQVTEGKRIFAQIYLNDIGVFQLRFGTLNQIKELYKEIYKGNRFDSLEAIIYPGEIEVKENDERTFSEIGIRDDFICKLKTKKNDIKKKKSKMNN